jgi:hypothetical protein
MAIVRMGGGAGGAELERRVGIKAAKKAAKKGAPDKHAAKKHAAKKDAAKKAAKKSAEAHHAEDTSLVHAFHHLQRASALISLLGPEGGSDLRHLLENGIDLYRQASGSKSEQGTARCAAGILRAVEHLGMAGLYSAREQFRVDVIPPSRKQIQLHVLSVSRRIEQLGAGQRQSGRRIVELARELLRRAGDTDDQHLEFELTMAADGLCTALEEGI